MDETTKKQKNATATAAVSRHTRAELVWDGKYDSAGRLVSPLRVSLPFQTIETVNESAQERQLSLDNFARGKTEWRNRLIWGDKKYVLPSLLAEFAGKVKLIYIDPPFDTGADFSFTATIPDDSNSDEDGPFTFVKEASIIEHKAYRDTWGRGLESYLQWFYEATIILHELLHETGSIFVHLDWHVVHYVKGIMDEVFGQENFRNEIVWKRKGGSANPQNRLGVVTDSILWFSKTDSATLNQQFTKTSEESQKYVEERFNRTDELGRRFMDSPLVSPNPRPNLKYEYKGFPPPPNGWSISKEIMEQWDKEGRLYFPSDKTKRIRRKIFLDEYVGQPIQNLWNDIYVINSQSNEFVGYETQKPETLLDRVIKMSSNEDDLVLDCFCGSGTTAVVAEKLRRRWIACDLSRFAIHTSRKRLLSISGVRPYAVQNLGKYERQLWAGAEFGDAKGSRAAARQRAYIEFVLKLAQATPLNGYTWLHGVKGGRMIHVGAVDAPISMGDVTQIAAEYKRAVGTGKDAPKTNGVDVLGWDFAFELNEVAKQQAAAANIQLRFLRIPHDAMDKRAVTQGDIHFFELAALSVEVKTNRRDVLLKLKNFVIPPDDVPEDVQRVVKHWSQWIDYWAVDWDNKADAFHNEWQTYRTRKDNKLALETTRSYSNPGEYAIVVKVIDILGNDTTKTVKVKVK
jgi:DNA modification methylase